MKTYVFSYSCLRSSREYFLASLERKERCVDIRCCAVLMDFFSHVRALASAFSTVLSEILSADQKYARL